MTGTAEASSAWMEELRARCAAQGQRKVALLLGYSPSVVSQVLSGSYRGDVTAVRRAVEGALMAATIPCPALGQDIGTQECLRFQRLPLAATTPARVRLHRTCPSCPHNRTAGRSGAEADAVETGGEQADGEEAA